MTRLSALVLVAVLSVPVGAAEPASVSVAPASIDLTHHRQPHAIQVLGTSADGYSLDLRDTAQLRERRPEGRDRRSRAG